MFQMQDVASDETRVCRILIGTEIDAETCGAGLSVSWQMLELHVFSIHTFVRAM